MIRVFNDYFSMVLNWVSIHTPLLPQNPLNPHGKLSSLKFQREILPFKLNSLNNNTTINSGTLVFMSRDTFGVALLHVSWLMINFRLKFAQQANAVGPWIQQKTEEIVGVALEMDGTLEQQIQKLKIYQVKIIPFQIPKFLWSP